MPALPLFYLECAFSAPNVLRKRSDDVQTIIERSTCREFATRVLLIINFSLSNIYIYILYISNSRARIYASASFVPRRRKRRKRKREKELFARREKEGEGKGARRVFVRIGQSLEVRPRAIGRRAAVLPSVVIAADFTPAVPVLPHPPPLPQAHRHSRSRALSLPLPPSLSSLSPRRSTELRAHRKMATGG